LKKIANSWATTKGGILVDFLKWKETIWLHCPQRQYGSPQDKCTDPENKEYCCMGNCPKISTQKV